MRGFADAVGEQQDVHYRRHDRRAHHDADAEHHLLAPGGGTDQLSGLEILQIVARDRRGVADHRADEHHRHGADRGFTAHHPHEYQRREQDGANGDAGDRVVRRTHEPRHIAADRGEQKARDDHDHGHGERHTQAADHQVVQYEQRYDEQSDAYEHRGHRHIAL